MEREEVFFIKQFINGELFSYKKIVAIKEDINFIKNVILKEKEVEEFFKVVFKIVDKETSKREYFKLAIEEEKIEELKEGIKGRRYNGIKADEVIFIFVGRIKANKKREKGEILEKLTEKKLKQKGYKVISNYKKKYDDEGIDIIAEKENKILLIQCKNWNKREITKNQISKFLGDCLLYEEKYKKELKNKKIERYIITNKDTHLSKKAKKILNNTKLVKLIKLGG